MSDAVAAPSTWLDVRGVKTFETDAGTSASSALRVLFVRAETATSPLRNTARPISGTPSCTDAAMFS